MLAPLRFFQEHEGDGGGHDLLVTVPVSETAIQAKIAFAATAREQLKRGNAGKFRFDGRHQAGTQAPTLMFGMHDEPADVADIAHEARTHGADHIAFDHGLENHGSREFRAQ
jgi:hypothetical protein